MKAPAGALRHGYDPELVYAECGRCGQPVYLKPGQATDMLNEIGIDPLELDPSCILIADGCPMCSAGGRFGIRIHRITDVPFDRRPPEFGNA
ncbi:MAG: hypothetical protein J5600_06090 [Desulfovibrio sp.]|nr:hypothetical protein [Desulfovibrio sp.]MBO4684879.1 hypothetical protein [Desulfovibrio sp.]MBR4746809.1 hypothetical protein [Desulfovibrio sp.]MBR6468644.1 hypothetical protein [Desulfovibrio sp.]